MNQRDVITTLQVQAMIEPGFTRLIWGKLEEQNPDFFKAYYTRLKVKEQIQLFNQLLEQHAQSVRSMQQGFNGHPMPMPAQGVPYSPHQPMVPVMHMYPHQPQTHPMQAQALPSPAAAQQQTAAQPSQQQQNTQQDSARQGEQQQQQQAAKPLQPQPAPGHPVPMMPSDGVPVSGIMVPMQHMLQHPIANGHMPVHVGPMAVPQHGIPLHQAYIAPRPIAPSQSRHKVPIRAARSSSHKSSSSIKAQSGMLANRPVAAAAPAAAPAPTPASTTAAAASTLASPSTSSQADHVFSNSSTQPTAGNSAVEHQSPMQSPPGQLPLLSPCDLHIMDDDATPMQSDPPDGAIPDGGGLLSHLPRNFSLSDLSAELTAQIQQDAENSSLGLFLTGSPSGFEEFLASPEHHPTPDEMDTGDVPEALGLDFDRLGSS
eukprot:jgi/Chlat1/1895/Chrsp145S08693